MTAAFSYLLQREASRDLHLKDLRPPPLLLITKNALLSASGVCQLLRQRQELVEQQGGNPLWLQRRDEPVQLQELEVVHLHQFHRVSTKYPVHRRSVV